MPEAVGSWFVKSQSWLLCLDNPSQGAQFQRLWMGWKAMFKVGVTHFSFQIALAENPRLNPEKQSCLLGLSCQLHNNSNRYCMHHQNCTGSACRPPMAMSAFVLKTGTYYSQWRDQGHHGSGANAVTFRAGCWGDGKPSTKFGYLLYDCARTCPQWCTPICLTPPVAL
jgi:hypothetical protein